MELTDGARVRVVVRHGPAVKRHLAGTLRRFEQDGEERWELIDVTEDRSEYRQQGPGQPGYEDPQLLIRHEAVGIRPENVVSIEPLE